MKKTIILLLTLLCITMFTVSASVDLFQFWPMQMQQIKYTTNGSAVNATLTFNYSIYTVYSGGSNIFNTGDRSVQVRDGVLSDDTAQFSIIPDPDNEYYAEIMVEGETVSTRINLSNAVLFSAVANNSLYLGGTQASAYALDSDVTTAYSTLRAEIDSNASQFYPNATVDALITGNLSGVSYDDAWINTTFDALITSNATATLSSAYNNDTYYSTDLDNNISAVRTDITNNATATLTSAYANDTYEHATLRAEIDSNASQFYPNATVDALITGNLSLAYANDSSATTTPSNLTFGLIVGFTTDSYKGNLSNSTRIGYLGANDFCNQEYPGSHMCLKSEILKSIANNTYDFSGTTWISNGPPGYTAEANDCSGWTTNSTTSLGPFWNWDLAGAGQGKLTNCGQEKKLACCGGA